MRGLDARTGEVKRMWVNPAWRGAGLGSRLLRELEAAAVERDYALLRLDTNLTLTDAIALYQHAGYHPVPATTTTLRPGQAWFDKALA